MSPEDLEAIEDAIAAHVAWMSRLRDAIARRSSEFSARIVRLDNQCVFGKWMYQGIPGAPRGSPAFEEIRATHAAFHEHAAAILQLALDGKTVQAQRLMDPKGEFMTTSGRLIVRLRELMER